MSLRRKFSFLLLVFVLLIVASLSSIIRKVEATQQAYFGFSTSNIFGGVGESWQRNSWYSHARFWVIWDDDSNLVYQSTTDGETFTSKTTIRVTRSPAYLCLFSLAYKDGYVHYSYSDDGGEGYLAYRRGTPSAGGTISWDAEQQVVTNASSMWGSCGIVVAEDGHVYISYSEEADWSITPCFVIKNDNLANQTGTWSTASGFPYCVEPIWAMWQCGVLSLTDGVLAWWSENTIGWNNTAKSLFYDFDTGWEGSPTIIDTDTRVACMGSSSYGNNAYLTWNGYFRAYTLGSGWGAKETIGHQVPMDSVATPLAVDMSNGDLYYFQDYNLTENERVLYMGWREGTTWHSLEKLYDIENQLGSHYEDVLVGSNCESVDGRIPIIFSSIFTGTPYNHHMVIINVNNLFHFYGLYDETDGSPLWDSETIDITVYWDTLPSETFTLNQSWVHSWETRPSYFHYELGTNDRKYWLMPEETAISIYIFKPSTLSDHEFYTFDIVDMVGITNGYLESVMKINGSSMVIERWKLDTLNDIPFLLSWGYVYDMRLQCDQGTHVFGSFVASETPDFTLYVTQVTFPPDASHIGDISFYSKRENSTWIRATYDDVALQTNWVSFKIYDLTGTSVITSTNNTGNTHTFNWYNARANTDYRVVVEAGHDVRGTLSWTIPLPASFTAESNPWNIDWLGTFPFASDQIIGVILVCLVFASFTQKSAPIGIVVGVVVAMFLALIGWLDISWTWLAISLGIAIIVALSMAKSRSVEY